MRKLPPSEADDAGRPAGPASEPAADASVPTQPVSTEPSTTPSLVWPPVDEELNEWEVIQLHTSGNTIIEPLKYTPPAASAAAGAARAPERTAPPTPVPYVPPSPIDDPVGEASLLPPLSSDFNLPETELIEPLHAPGTATMPILSPVSGARPAATTGPMAVPPPVSGDDRTIMIPRPAAFAAPHAHPPAAPPQPPVTGEETYIGTPTRILVAPNFAATVGHAPTVPVSALHRAAVPPRPGETPRPMEDTLPAGMTREILARSIGTDDSTGIHPSPTADTHPMTSPAPPRPTPVPLGPVGVPGPFSRVPSRGAQPHLTSSGSTAPPALTLAPPPDRTPESAPTRPRITPPAAITTPTPAPVGAPVPARVAAPSTRAQLTWLGIGVAAILAIGVGLYQYLSMRDTSAAALSPATLSVDSTPQGAAVSIDGTPRGTTPLRLELTEGQHTLDVAAGGTTKKIPLALVAGTVTAHTIEFVSPAAPAAAAAADAAIEVRSEPQGGKVRVDGVARGTTPLVVTGLTAGRHEVQVSGPFRTVTRTVTVAAKQQALLVVTPARTETPGVPRSARVSTDTGFITIQSPIVLRVVRNGDFVGTSEDGKLSLPAGPQVIGLENESVGFRDVRTVDVAGGKVTPVTVSLPDGAISINARPWAEVFVDGERIGETPVSQKSLPIGIHEIVFKHPDFGERRVSVLVKIGATGRAFTDFTK